MNPHPTLNMTPYYMGYVEVDSYLWVDLLISICNCFSLFEVKTFQTSKKFVSWH